MKGAFGLPFSNLTKGGHAPVKIAVINGRQVWVEDDYASEEPAKVEPVKAEEPAKVETKAKKAPANKARKAGSNK